LATVFLAGLILSCATGPYKPSAPDENIIGPVRATFEVRRGYYSGNPLNEKKEINEAAYIALLQAAQKEYQGNIDIRDITWVQGKFIKGIPKLAATYEYNATGKVILISNTNRITSAMDSPLSKAADRLIEDLVEELPRRTTVAILSVYSNDPAASSYALEKIEQRFYDARHFSIIEKRFIDDVRRDKRLQESDDIDQAKAVELAREEGWNVVVIGEISGSGSSRRLTLRAIDAEKATILSRAMENF
jgi:hypothetical protein